MSVLNICGSTYFWHEMLCSTKLWLHHGPMIHRCNVSARHLCERILLVWKISFYCAAWYCIKLRLHHRPVIPHCDGRRWDTGVEFVLCVRCSHEWNPDQRTSGAQTCFSRLQQLVHTRKGSFPFSLPYTPYRLNLAEATVVDVHKKFLCKSLAPNSRWFPIFFANFCSLPFFANLFCRGYRYNRLVHTRKAIHFLCKSLAPYTLSVPW